jgi:hypothetical protein
VIVDEIVEPCGGCLRLDGIVDDVPTKAVRAVGDADPRAKNERRALREHGTEELEKNHQVLQGISHAPPYLARQLSGFIRLPTEGYTQGGRFWVGMR